jgi:hypothetical protein
MKFPQSAIKKSFMVVAMAACIFFVVGSQRAQANPVGDLLDYVLSALDSISESLDVLTAGQEITYVDTWLRDDEFGNLLYGWTRQVPAIESQYFEMNASITCSFTGGTEINKARISFRSKENDPFLSGLVVESTDQLVNVITGPMVGYGTDYSSYSVQCIPGSDRSWSQVVASVKFEALPEPEEDSEFVGETP